MLPLYGGGFWIAFLQASIVYYVGAAIIHFAVPALVPVTSVQVGNRKSGQLAQEALNSIGPLAIKAGIWTIVEHMYASGHGHLYSGPLLSSWNSILYAVATIIALDYLHDTWFYWTHRLLHWGPLFTKVHYMHHRSNVPTAFCGYSFHIIEATIVFLNEILVCYLMPIHIGLHRVYHMYTTLIHSGGHAGYEIAPFIPSIEAIVALMFSGKEKPADALNTVRHHDMHHRFPNVHFSLYMTHWDRLMGTEHKNYRSAVEQHFTKVVD